MKFTIFLITILVIFFFSYSYYLDKNLYVRNLKYYRKDFKPNLILKSVFNQFNIKESKNMSNANIIIPKYYFGEKDHQFRDLVLNKKQVMFICPGILEIDRKELMWTNLVNVYGIKNASKLTPRCYSYNEFKNDKSGCYFIIKNEREDAKDIIISNNKDVISKVIKENNKHPYTVIQKVITNPDLIKGHAYKLRMFVLFKCNNGRLSCYLYSQGIIFYARKKWGDKLTNETVVANGYWYKHVDEDYLNNVLYDKPDTTQELEHFDIDRIKTLVYNVCEPMRDKMCYLKNIPKSTNLCGIDIMYDSNKKPWFIELNKKPGMGTHKILKENIWKEVLYLNFPIDYDRINYEINFMKIM